LLLQQNYHQSDASKYGTAKVLFAQILAIAKLLKLLIIQLATSKTLKALAHKARFIVLSN